MTRAKPTTESEVENPKSRVMAQVEAIIEPRRDDDMAGRRHVQRDLHAVFSGTADRGYAERCRDALARASPPFPGRGSPRPPDCVLVQPRSFAHRPGVPGCGANQGGGPEPAANITESSDHSWVCSDLSRERLLEPHVNPLAPRATLST
jgi:hypothetical protein